MQDDIDTKRNFLNRRDWGSYLAALQNAAARPKVMDAVKCSRAWFTQGAAQASHWLTAASESGRVQVRPNLRRCGLA